MAAVAARARSEARARRLEVLRARTVEALVRIAGAARKERTAKGFSMSGVIGCMHEDRGPLSRGLGPARALAHRR
jgi:hypothetical protein